MARVYSLDLRQRVIDAIEGGLSTCEAARRFAIGIATAGALHRRWCGTGSARPGRQGQPPGSKLDAHDGFIFGLVAKYKDIALYDIAERLAAERGVRMVPSTVHQFFVRCGITYKKRQRMPRSGSDRTSSPAAAPGSTACPMSSRSG